MITKPYGGGAGQQSVHETAGDDADDELSLFVYDSVQQSAVSYHDCQSSVRPTELVYRPHPGQQQQQQQQGGCGEADEDDAVVKLQLLTGCGNNTLVEYPWMRDKKTALSESMTSCLTATSSMSDRPAALTAQCLSSDPQLLPTPGRHPSIYTDLLSKLNLLESKSIAGV